MIRGRIHKDSQIESVRSSGDVGESVPPDSLLAIPAALHRLVPQLIHGTAAF